MMEEFADKLQSQGYRLTPQRLIILRILQQSETHLPPVEIFNRALEEMPGITEATVYRTLNFLHQQGMALAAHIGSGQLVYEIAGRDHHHLICRHCGHTHEINHELLAALYQQFNENTGYRIDSVHMTFFGACPACQ